MRENIRTMETKPELTCALEDGTNVLSLFLPLVLFKIWKSHTKQCKKTLKSRRKEEQQGTLQRNNRMESSLVFFLTHVPQAWRRSGQKLRNARRYRKMRLTKAYSLQSKTKKTAAYLRGEKLWHPRPLISAKAEGRAPQHSCQGSVNNESSVASWDGPPCSQQ